MLQVASSNLGNLRSPDRSTSSSRAYNLRWALPGSGWVCAGPGSRMAAVSLQPPPEKERLSALRDGPPADSAGPLRLPSLSLEFACLTRGYVRCCDLRWSPPMRLCPTRPASVAGRHSYASDCFLVVVPTWGPVVPRDVDRSSRSLIGQAAWVLMGCMTAIGGTLNILSAPLRGPC